MIIDESVNFQIIQLIMPNHLSRYSTRNHADNFKIKEIPHLSTPLSISQLNYSHNDIRSIASHIAAATHLQILDLSHNKIRKIEYIYQIRSLKFVNLSFNLISEIPNEMLSMVELQNLDMSYNKLSVLSSIQILKSLVQIRVLQRKGSIEINLEGNEVMNKRSCRETCQKWLHPHLEDYRAIEKSLQYESTIGMTKKRNSKSLQLKYQDMSGLQTRRVVDYFQQKEEGNSLRSKQEYCYEERQKGRNSRQDSCLSPNFPDANLIRDDELTAGVGNNIVSVKSEMIRGERDCQVSQQMQLSSQTGEPGQLDQWFSLCLAGLKELSNNFSAIISSEDINNLDAVLKQKIIQESLYVEELIEMSEQTINLSLDHRLSKHMENEYLAKTAIINDKIRNQHYDILQLFGQKQSLPIRLYKPWVAQFRKLKQIVKQIPQKVVRKQLSFMREQQINQLIDISPEKIMLTPSIQEIQSQKKSDNIVHNTADKNKLSDLLFSKDKEDCLLLSQGKRSLSSSQARKQQHSQRPNEECEECLLSRWQLSKLKQQMKELVQRNELLSKQRNQHVAQIEELQKIKEKYLSIECKQELIIEELDHLTPSTYQNILLEQAKAIEFMINSEYRGQFPQLGIENGCVSQDRIASTDKARAKQSYTGKEGINTHLSSNKNSKTGSMEANMISEFTINDRKELIAKENSNNTRGSSYFKNKNIVTTVNRTGDPLTNNNEDLATEGDLRQNQRNDSQLHEVVISQFNSESNTLSHQKSAIISQDKKANSNSRIDSKSKSRQKGKSSKIVNEKTEKSSQNDVILLSQGSDLKNLNNCKWQQPKYCSLGENRQNALSFNKSSQFDRILNDKLNTQKGILRKQQQEKWPNSVTAKQILKKSTSPSQVNSNTVHMTLNDSAKQNRNQNKKTELLKRAKTTDRLVREFMNGYKEHEYVPLQSQEGDRYKKYLQYHLRNNIIEILSKKSAHLNENGLSKKWNFLTSSHKLIHKKGEQNDGCTDGPNSQINKTFR